MEINIDTIIKNACRRYNSRRLVSIDGCWQNNYFFFKEEETPAHHLIPYKTRYIDYIAKKEYNTLHEWATENGRTIHNIAYGIQNSIYYVDLNDMLRILQKSSNRCRSS